MKTGISTSLFFAFISITCSLNAQFKNGDFTLGNANVFPQVINEWANGGAQFVPDGSTKNEDAWVDLTGTGYGNGYYIEQTVKTEKGQLYFLSFDLGTFFGWDLWDAGVSISLDGKPFGGRIYHSNYTYSQENIISWMRMRSAYFEGNGDSMTIRFTGDSRLVTDNGWNRGVGVIAFDNVSLEKYQVAGLYADSAMAEVSAFPNPANQLLHIVLPDDADIALDVELTDMLGRVVWFKDEQLLEKNYSINTSELLDGIYYLKIIADNQFTSIRKIIISH